MRTVLITGAGGFTARHLIRRLRSGTPVEIVGLDYDATPIAEGLLDRCYRMDIGDPAIGAMMRSVKPDCIFHLAGQSSGPAQSLYQTNVIGAVNLLEAVQSHVPAAAVLLVGSAAEYGRGTVEGPPYHEEQPCAPIDPYGISKYAMTMAGLDYAHRCGLKVVIARPFNIVGAGMPATRVVGAILNRIAAALDHTDPIIKMGNLASARDFVAVEDVVEAYVRFVTGDCWGQVFNICSGNPRTIREILNFLLAHCSRQISVVIDQTLVRKAEVDISFGSYEKARKAIGFEPSVGLEDALRRAWAAVLGSPSALHYPSTSTGLSQP